MENLTLQFKKEQESELKILKEKNARQKLRYIYINEIIKEIENKFHELMEFKIDFTDFLDFLYNINNEIIYKEVLYRLEKTTKIIINEKTQDTNKIKKLYDMFYNEIRNILIELKRINHGKYNKILLIDHTIDEINHSIDFINDEGEITEPISIDTLDDIMKQIKYSKFNLIELMQEITLKNNNAIRTQLAKQNARKIRERRNAKRKTKITSISLFDPTTLTKEQKQIFDEAQNIIKNDFKELESINDIEEAFIDDMYKANNIEEIIQIIELMNDYNSSLKLLIHNIKQKINTLDEKNANNNIEIIKSNINLYKKYKIKYKQEQEENKKMQDEINTLKNELNEILEEINEDKENIIDKLNTKQITSLLSFQEIDTNIEDEILNQINETLSKEELNVEFLIYYNSYKEITKKINKYMELKENYKTKELLKKIREIIKEYETYKNTKNNYIEKIDFDEELEQENEKNIILFLTDNNEITYAQHHIESLDPLTPTEYNSLIELIDKLKINSSTYIHTIARNVLPKDDNYKKRRIRKGNLRVVFYQINNKLINTEKPVFLIITAGRKISSKYQIYDQANHLKENVLELVKTLEKYDEKQINEFIEKQKEIEKNFYKNINNNKTKKAGGHK